MNGRNTRTEKTDKKPTAPPKADHPVERDPAVEWGERIATGKDIARGGKKKGFVPGASEQPGK